MPAFSDTGSWNLRDLDTGTLVGKIYVETPAGDIAGGRGYKMHYALVKSAIGDSGWGVYAKPTAQNNKQFKWEGTSETFANFTAWVADPNRRPNLRYVVMGAREQDVIP